MKLQTATRDTRRSLARLAGVAVLSCAWLAPATGATVFGRPQQNDQPAPIERRPPSTVRQAPNNQVASPDPNSSSTLAAVQRRENPRGPRGEHLAEWMSLHSNLTPTQQEKALEGEPGFRDLPQQTQQRMRDRLLQLNAMTPAQRQRLLARNEAMEKLNPEQRAEVRSAMSQLGSLPVDQRREVARTFRSLRDLPADQRLTALNSGRYGTPMNDAQRSVLYNLLRVEPMLPPPEPAPAR